MQNINSILEQLKSRGFRNTTIREALLNIFFTHHTPLTSADAHALLLRKKIIANKTTVYRELTFLMEQGFVRELQFGDRIARYEITPDNHHHHLVCMKCDRVEDVVLPKDLDAAERAIARNKKFKVLTHALEFFGVCAHCG